MYESMVTFTTLLLSEVVKIIFFESFLALSRFTFVHNLQKMYTTSSLNISCEITVLSYSKSNEGDQNCH